MVTHWLFTKKILGSNPMIYVVGSKCDCLLLSNPLCMLLNTNKSMVNKAYLFAPLKVMPDQINIIILIQVPHKEEKRLGPLSLLAKKKYWVFVDSLNVHHAFKFHKMLNNWILKENKENRKCNISFFSEAEQHFHFWPLLCSFILIPEASSHLLSESQLPSQHSHYI